MEKAPGAFRTISEVAQELEVPQHVLRFWESRFREIRPMKRGGGRRYYRPDDLDLLRGIRHLLYGEGYTIRGVQRLLRGQAADASTLHRLDDMQQGEIGLAIGGESGRELMREQNASGSFETRRSSAYVATPQTCPPSSQ